MVIFCYFSEVNKRGLTSKRVRNNKAKGFQNLFLSPETSIKTLIFISEKSIIISQKCELCPKSMNSKWIELTTNMSWRKNTAKVLNLVGKKASYSSVNKRYETKLVDLTRFASVLKLVGLPTSQEKNTRVMSIFDCTWPLGRSDNWNLEKSHKKCWIWRLLKKSGISEGR